MVVPAPMAVLHHTAWKVRSVDEIGYGGANMVRHHPERHELVSLAARHSWDQARVERELADRFATQLGRAAG